MYTGGGKVIQTRQTTGRGVQSPECPRVRNSEDEERSEGAIKGRLCLRHGVPTEVLTFHHIPFRRPAGELEESAAY